MSPPSDHPVIGRSEADIVAVATGGTVCGRESVGRVSTGGEIVETFDTH